MPTYRYRCDTCGDEIEVWQSIHDDPLTTHEGDGGQLRKVLQPVGVVLKGSGFYKNDSRSGSKSNGASSSSSKDKESKESKDSKDSKDSKPSSDTSSSDSGDSKKDSSKPASKPLSD
jgi:putative FmdB family regulatory protein